MKDFKIIYIVLLILGISGCSEEAIDINAKATLKGRVVEAETFNPVENAKISTNPSSSTVFTDADGRFEFEVDAGQYAVQAEKDTFLVAFESATLEAEEVIELVFELSEETANNRPPEIPLLVAPVDGAIDVSTTATLEWLAIDPDEDDLTYDIELRKTSDNTVQNFEDITDVTLDVTVDFGETYLWNVTASDGINQEVISATFSFTTSSFPSNRFAFVKKENGNNVIYSGDDNGTTVALTSNTENSWRPRVNRQVNKIAYLRSVGAQVHVFTMNLDGTSKQQITTSIPVSGFNLEEIDISWSNNGAFIYYPAQDKLYRINVNGSGLTQIFQTSNGKLISDVDVNDPVIALKVNDLSGYQVEIFTINLQGTVLNNVISGMTGAFGGIDLSADNSRLLYTRDFSGFENNTYRQLDTRMYIYDFNTMVSTDISFNKDAGTNDLDARFSPTEAQVIYKNQANDNNSPGVIQTLEVTLADSREDLFANSMMPDWE